MPASSPLTGQVLGHYRVAEQIGAGGMGIVFRAQDERLGRDVALKILPPGAIADEDARRRFRREAETLSQLNHPNIETVHDFDTQDDTDFLVMELPHGQTVATLLAQGPMAEKKLVQLGAQLAQGLAAAHERGIIHRDLKPSNLLLSDDGNLKILDFGLAKLVQPRGEFSETASLALTQGVVGTLPYMSPEQLRNEKLDARTDIYSAGVILYEMATGRRPHSSTDPMLIAAILHQ